MGAAESSVPNRSVSSNGFLRILYVLHNRSNIRVELLLRRYRRAFLFHRIRFSRMILLGLILLFFILPLDFSFLFQLRLLSSFRLCAAVKFIGDSRLSLSLSTFIFPLPRDIHQRIENLIHGQPIVG